ncbi:MAG: metallophosphoesterase family protein, partial [Bacteroidota bacterium]
MRRPYIQSAIADSVSILWRTDIGDQCKVGYKQQGETDWKFVSGVNRLTNTEVIENEVTLKNLTPNKTYEYQIFTNEKQLLEDNTFSFPSPVGPNDSIFSFFAVGDVGEPVEEAGTPDKLGEVLSLYKDSYHFGVLLGDIIYPDGQSELYDSNLFQYFGGVFPYVPVFTILGNHDWHEPENNY